MRFHHTRTKKEREEKYEKYMLLIIGYVVLMVIGLFFTGGQ